MTRRRPYEPAATRSRVNGPFNYAIMCSIIKARSEEILAAVEAEEKPLDDIGQAKTEPAGKAKAR